MYEGREGGREKWQSSSIFDEKAQICAEGYNE